MDGRRMTDIEMEMFARQRRENRKAILALIGLVGGLSGLAILLASLSKSGRDDDRVTSIASTSHSEASSKPAAAPPAPAPEPAPAPAVVPAPRAPAAASADDVRRLVKEQKQTSVIACIEHAGRKVAHKAKVTVKLDLKTPDRLAKIEVIASPKSPKLVSCVKSEMKGLAVPRLASNMTVTVPFKVESARGRRPAR